MTTKELFDEFERVRAIGGSHMGSMMATDSKQRGGFLNAFGQECMFTFAKGEPLVIKNRAGQIVKTSPVEAVVQSGRDFMTKIWTKSGTYYCFMPNFSGKPF